MPKCSIRKHATSHVFNSPFSLPNYFRSTNSVFKSLLKPTHRLTVQRQRFQTTIQAAMKDRTIDSLGPQLQAFIREKQALCQAENVHICDGSEEENEFIVNQMIDSGMMKRLPLLDEW